MNQQLDKIAEAEDNFDKKINKAKEQENVLMKQARKEADLEIEKLWAHFEEKKAEIQQKSDVEVAKCRQEIYEEYERQRVELKTAYDRNHDQARDLLIEGVFKDGN